MTAHVSESTALTRALGVLECDAEQLAELLARVQRRQPMVDQSGRQWMPTGRAARRPRRVRWSAVELPEFAIAAAHLRACYRAAPELHVQRAPSSYGLKHEAQQAFGYYVSNGAMILAGAAADVALRFERGDLNAQLYVARIGTSSRGERVPGARAISPRLRALVFERDGFRCRRCGWGAPDVRLVLDHVVPVARGGDASAENLQTLCWDCNAGKGDRDPHAHDLRLA